MNQRGKKSVTLEVQGYSLKNAERSLIERVLQDFPHKNKSELSRILGITHSG